MFDILIHIYTVVLHTFVLVVCLGSWVPDPFVEGQKILIPLLRVRKSWSLCWGPENPDPLVEVQEFLILLVWIRNFLSIYWGSGISDPFIKAQSILKIQLVLRNCDPLLKLRNFDMSSVLMFFYRLGLTSCETLQYWKDFNRHARPDYLRMQLSYHLNNSMQL